MVIKVNQQFVIIRKVLIISKWDDEAEAVEHIVQVIWLIVCSIRVTVCRALVQFVVSCILQRAVHEV